MLWAHHLIRIWSRNKESALGLTVLHRWVEDKWCRDNFRRRRGNWEHHINQRYLRDVFHVVVTSLIFILMFFEFIPASPQVATFCLKFFTLQENLTSFSSARLLWRSREELSMLVSAKWSVKLMRKNIWLKMNVLIREMQHFHTIIIKCVTQPKKRCKFHNWIFLQWLNNCLDAFWYTWMNICIAIDCTSSNVFSIH